MYSRRRRSEAAVVWRSDACALSIGSDLSIYVVVALELITRDESILVLAAECIILLRVQNDVHADGEFPAIRMMLLTLPASLHALGHLTKLLP